MRVSLTHSEIQSAVVAELERRGVVVQGFDISVSFSMGRKGTGLTGTVDLVDPTITVLPPVVETEAVVVPEEAVASPDASVVSSDEPTSDSPFVADPVVEPDPTPEPEVASVTSVVSTAVETPPEPPKSLFAQ